MAMFTVTSPSDFSPCACLIAFNRALTPGKRARMTSFSALASFEDADDDHVRACADAPTHAGAPTHAADASTDDANGADTNRAAARERDIRFINAEDAMSTVDGAS
jgi:hypothetical protein